jgi:hypothetical protein
MATNDPGSHGGVKPSTDAGAGILSAPNGGRRDPWMRTAAMAGAATLPLVVVSSMISDVAASPGLNPGSPDSEMLEVFVAYRGRHLIAASMLAAAAVTTLIFLGPLWARVRLASEWLAVVAVAGGVAAGVLWVAGAGWSLTAAVAADYGDVDAARFLMVSGWEISRLGVAPHLVMVAATTLAGIRHHAFGRVFNAFGLAFTALLLFGLLPFAPAGLMGMLATLWVLVAACVLAFSESPVPQPLQ